MSYFRGISKLAANPLVQGLASYQSQRDAINAIAGGPKGSIRGTIVSVDDPEKRGRIKVVFDDMNPKKPQIAGAQGDGGYGDDRPGGPTESHWIDVTPPFKGTQPKKLVGMRVNIAVTDGEYQYAIAQDVLWDQVLNGKSEAPTNSTMTRLPVYESGELPEACKENHGCMVVEDGGPLQSDWLCVCLKRNGKYFWVRHIDLAHGHAGQNDSVQRPDTDGDAQIPINNMSIWDYVFPTTAGEMNKQSGYGSSPRGNPFGSQAGWNGGAK